MTVTVLSEDEYQAQEFDAALIRERSVVCVDADEDRTRLIPLSKVSHVDGDSEALVTGTELPEWFHGGGGCGFVDVDQFPELERHLEDLERETA